MAILVKMSHPFDEFLGSVGLGAFNELVKEEDGKQGFPQLPEVKFQDPRHGIGLAAVYQLGEGIFSWKFENKIEKCRRNYPARRLL